MPPEGRVGVFVLRWYRYAPPQYPMATLLNIIQQHDPAFGVLDGDNVRGSLRAWHLATRLRGYVQETLADPAVRRFRPTCQPQ
jgi:hypothetical protein